MRISIILLTVIFLSGCPLEGDDGQTGTAGISCWDLNENYVKDPSEDTNGDTVVDVWDCRASFKNTGYLTDTPTAGEFSWEFSGRKSYFSAYLAPPEQQIVAYSGTLSDYLAVNPLDPASHDGYLVNPIQDPCNLWKWVEDTSVSGFYRLQANDAMVYQSMHFAAVATDAADNTYYGFQSCASACLHDTECVGATYATDEFTTFEGTQLDNSLTCHLLRKVNIDLDSNTEYFFAQTTTRGALTGGMKYTSALATGFISACSN